MPIKTKKTFLLAGILSVLLPLSVFAATLSDDVTLVLPSTGESYTLDSISSFDSLNVNSDSFVFELSGGQSVRIHSADRRKLTNNQNASYTCDSSESLLSYQAPAGLSVTLTITPADTCSSGGGGGIPSLIGIVPVPVQTPVPVPTPTTPSSGLAEAQIQSILSLLHSFGADQAMIANVNASLRGQAVNTTGITLTTLFTRALSLGAKNSDVHELQIFLAKDKAIYPEGKVTGYFGILTKNAVKRFQKKYGIDPIGIVGPKTRARLNELMQMGERP